jgi:lipopolysaccharide transport system permease protein
MATGSMFDKQLSTLSEGEPAQSRPLPPGQAELDQLPETVVEAGPGWQLINLRELWRFRDLLAILAWRDVKVRYKQTVLGVAWAVLQPTLCMILFTAFLGKLAHVPSGDIPYPLFVYAGLLLWTLFATGVSGAANSVISSEQLITKVYFPRMLIPVAAVGVALVDFLVAAVVLVILMACYGYWPGWSVLWAPALIGLTALAAIGAGAFLAAVTVRYRDFRHVLPVLMQFGILATPVIYLDASEAALPPNAANGTSNPVAAERAPVPAGLRVAFDFNPLNGIIGEFRSSLLGRVVSWRRLLVPGVIVLAIFAVGCLFFQRAENSFADTI